MNEDVVVFYLISGVSGFLPLCEVGFYYERLKANWRWMMDGKKSSDISF